MHTVPYACPVLVSTSRPYTAKLALKTSDRGSLDTNNTVLYLSICLEMWIIPSVLRLVHGQSGSAAAQHNK